MIRKIDYVDIIRMSPFKETAGTYVHFLCYTDFVSHSMLKKVKVPLVLKLSDVFDLATFDFIHQHHIITTFSIVNNCAFLRMVLTHSSSQPLFLIGFSRNRTFLEF